MNALTTQTVASTELSSYQGMMNPAVFDHMQRVGKMLAMSPLFPEHLRKGSMESALANGVLVINMAMRLREDPLTVAQNIYFVGGKPGWNTTYMIAKANMHGVFKDVIDWEVKGKGDSLSVTAFGILKTTGKRVSVTCDMDMAKREGWTKNAKYQSMPEQMLRYRSAAFLIRLYCPEVMIGLPAQVELEMEVRDITPASEPVTVKANAEAPIEAKPVKAPEDRATAAVEDQPKKEEAKRVAEDVQDTDPGPTEVVDAETGEVLSEAHNDPAATKGPAPDRDRFDHLAGMIITDIQAGTPMQDIEDLYGPQLELISTHFPDMRAAIDAAVSAQARA